MGKAWLLLLPLIAGCSAHAVQPTTVSDIDCRQYFAEVDRAVLSASVQDEGPRPIPDFPYLRVDRFLASFAGEVGDQARFFAWVERLAALDHEARAFEIANLPERVQQRLAAIAPGNIGTIEAVNICRSRLIHSELSLPANRDRLRAQAQVPDDYVSVWRIIGLYPLTALFVKAGISKWHRETFKTFALPMQKLPQQGRWRTWGRASSPMLSDPEVAELLRSSADNPLAIPDPDVKEREVLFNNFAPQWIIDTVDDNDIPGTPYFSPTSSTALLDINRPAVFRRISHTRFNGKVLLQLNYIIWFKSRPKLSAFDIYAGKFDGINFRITLGSDGRPLLYDAIHNCGCYHMFFPVAPLSVDESAFSFWTEPPLVPQVLNSTGRDLQVYVSAGEHFIQRLTFTGNAAGEPYYWDDYARLRSLPVGVGLRRSLFGKHGILDGSQRPERVLLWPMGIRSPGAMRQWGRHSTAFVGRRHFDDPFLVEHLFTMTPKKETSP